MNVKKVTAAAIVALAMVACQNDTCRINGEARSFKDGTWLYLTADLNNGTPADSLCVRHGRFVYQQTTGTTSLCLIYPAGASPCSGITFFTEPGNIYIELVKEPGRSRVSGTKVNNEWQALNDSISRCDHSIRTLMRNSRDSISLQRLSADLQRLYDNMEKAIGATAQRNLDNALGQFINSHYRSQ